MVKLNFKGTPPISSEEGTSQPEKKVKPPEAPTDKPSQRRDEDLDLSFSSTESLFPKVEPSSEEQIKEETFEPKPVKPTQSDKEVFDEFEEEYYGSKRSGLKIFIVIALIIIVIAVGTFFGIKFIQSKKTQRVTKVPIQEQPVGQTPATATPAIVTTLGPIFEKNISDNSYISQQIKNFISKKPKSADYSLIVMTPSEINLTILTGSQDSFAQFKLELRKMFPNLNFNTISVQSNLAGGRENIYADLRASISGVKSKGASIPEHQIKTPRNFTTDINKLAQKHKVNIQTLKEGKKMDKKLFSEKHYYINLSSKKENIIPFLNDLTQNHPNAHLNKLSLNPYNFKTLSDHNFMTRINLTYYNPK